MAETAGRCTTSSGCVKLQLDGSFSGVALGVRAKKSQVVDIKVCSKDNK